jgi:ABC-type uncharacterized transport system involved in gliding motility auxiliary subunit
MDPNDETKKIIDVVAPSITKHPSGMAQNSQDSDTPSSEDSGPVISNSGATITPPTLNNDEQPTQVPEATPTEEVAENPTTEAKPTVPYEATDALPDSIAIATTQATDAMQSPKIYDTKEYMVPIHDTMHGHGFVGKIIAALVSVAILLAVLYVVLVFAF